MEDRGRTQGNVGSHGTPSVGWSYHGDGWQWDRWVLGQQREKPGEAAGALDVLLEEAGEAQGYRWPKNAVGCARKKKREKCKGTQGGTRALCPPPSPLAAQAEAGTVGTRFVSSQAVTPVCWGAPALAMHSWELPGSSYSPALIHRVLVVTRQDRGPASPELPSGCGRWGGCTGGHWGCGWCQQLSASLQAHSPSPAYTYQLSLHMALSGSSRPALRLSGTGRWVLPLTRCTLLVAVRRANTRGVDPRRGHPLQTLYTTATQAQARACRRSQPGTRTHTHTRRRRGFVCS